MTRLIAFYGILAVIVAGVAAVVINSGADEKPMPAIAGGYDATALNACIGAVPPPVKGAPLPSTAPASAPPSGPSFNVLQSGQFINFTNNASTLGGQLRMHRGADAKGTFHLTGDVKCVNGGKQKLDARVLPGAKGQIAGTLDGAPFMALLKRDGPDPGAANPRTPPHIDGLYSVTPRSNCLGGRVRDRR